MRRVTVSDEHTISADLDSVYDCFWNAECWPRITPHVRKIEMIEADTHHQRMLMTVEAHDRLYTVESMRETLPKHTITYRQTRPPVFLTEHTGEWHLDEIQSGVRVRLMHHAVIDVQRAMETLGLESEEEAVETVRRTLKTNGERTIVAVKHHLESRAGHVAGQH